MITLVYLDSAVVQMFILDKNDGFFITENEFECYHFDINMDIIKLFNQNID
jgi:hypothetical protein